MSQHNILIHSPGQEQTTAIPSGRFDSRTENRELPGTSHWRVEWRTLQGGPADGVLLVELCNGPLTVSVLPTRGMGIWKADLEGIPLSWDSPVRQLVHPRHVDLGSRNGLGWLDGFNELLCRCGLASNGPPGQDDGAVSPIESQLTLHGRTANTPAHTVEAGYDTDEGTIWVRGIVDECTLFGPQLQLTSTASTEGGANSLTVTDEVLNLSSRTGECQLLYHLNIGRPFLAEGSTILCPHRNVCPRDARAAEGIDSFDTYLGPTPGYAEQVYFYEPLVDEAGRAHALLMTADRSLGLHVRFDAAGLPCLSIWKCTQSEADGYVTGIEPGTNYPNFKSFEREQGRVPLLASGQSFETQLTLTILSTADQVDEIAEELLRLQGDVTPHVHRKPVRPFAPA